VLPTVLDLYGVLGHDRHAGWSLLRPPLEAPPIPITNCTPSFPCPIPTWGMLDGDVALEAQAWDGGWRCVALGAAEVTADDPRCARLDLASRAVFPTKPNGAPNR
jgi:hypothetical protein